MLKARPTALGVALALAIAAGCAGHGAGGGATPTPSPTSSASPTPTPITPFSCKGQPLPTSAPDPMSLGVEVQDESMAGSSVPLQGAVEQVVRTAGPMFLGSANTDAAGVATVSVPTGGAPLDGFIRSSRNTFLGTDAYPAVPFSKDVSGFSIGMLKSSTLQGLAAVTGASQSPTNAFLVVRVVDCTGLPLAGAVVSTTPAGTVRYFSGGSPSSSASSTDVGGVALVFDVAPGNVTVAAVVGSNALLQHVVAAQGSSVTQADIAPGPL